MVSDSNSAISTCTKIDWDSLRDNRDFSLHLNLHRTHEAMHKAFKEQTFEETKLWLRMRSLLLRAFLYALQSTSQSSEDVKGDAFKQANDHIKESSSETNFSTSKSNGTDNQEDEDPVTLLSSTITQLNEINSQIQKHQEEQHSLINVSQYPVGNLACL